MRASRSSKTWAVALAATTLLGGMGCSTSGADQVTPTSGTGGASAAGGNAGVSSGGAPTPAAGAGTPSSAGGVAGDANGGAPSAGAGAAGAAGASGNAGKSAAGAPAIVDPGSEGDGKLTISKPFHDDPAQTVAAGTPRGQRVDFSMQSADSKIYPLDGFSKPFTRAGAVYLPPNYVSGTTLPFMVAQDGVGNIKYVDIVPPALDNLIHDKKVPALAVIFIDPGPDSSDHSRSERSNEYDSVSGLYTTFVETEVIPAAKQAVKENLQVDLVLTDNPEGRGTLGGSSGGACAFTMGWFHPELYRKILSYSGSFQRLRATPEYPQGAESYHNAQYHLIASADPKPLRIALQIGTNDSASAVMVNEAMFAALTAKGNHVRYIVANGGGHVDQAVQRQTLADYLVWLWRGYPVE